MATAHISLLLLLLLVPSAPSSAALSATPPPPDAPPTPDDCPQTPSLAAYEVVLRTFWTRDLFPKHYPDWRPAAQWSRLVGRSHGASSALFRLGAMATEGVKAFAESGRSDALDAEEDGGAAAVLDAFSAPAIPTGAGHTTATFFVDGNHSRVSVMVRIVPSPDWFIGVDNFNLCVNGNWLDTITLEGDPLDAGTDNGFTFTSPNWATQPQGVIYRLTSTYPSHPAGSFYYPNLKRLPTIATFQFIKLREYELSKKFHRPRDASEASSQVVALRSRDEKMEGGPNATVLPHDASRLDNQSRNNDLLSVLGTRNDSQGSSTVDAALLLPKGDRDAIVSSIIDKYRRGRRPGQQQHHPVSGGRRRDAQHHHQHQGVGGGGGAAGSPESTAVHDARKIRKRPRKSRPPRNCHVTEWGDWSACSKSCGIGEMQRRRHVVRHARGGGAVCPPLVETKWCGSARPCSETYFQW